MKVLHVCETIRGGPASYFEEILPFQITLYGSENVHLLAPESEAGNISLSCHGSLILYRKSGRNLRSLLALWRAIQSAVRLHKPDILHLHSSFAGALGRLAISSMPDRPKVIYCAHCWSFDRSPKALMRPVWALIERYLMRWTDLVINISPHERGLLLKNNFSLEKVELIENGIKELQSATEVVPKSAGAPLSLLFAGRMDEQKGFDLLVKEFDDVDRSRATLTVLGSKVVGGAHVTLRPSIHFVGWVPREKVIEYLAAADALVMPSRWEGMPLAALEAFQMSVPVVASNRGPFPYIIEDGVNGLLMDIDKPGFLLRAIERLEASDLRAMKTAANATFKRKYTSNRLCNELSKAYQKLVAEPEKKQDMPVHNSILDEAKV